MSDGPEPDQLGGTGWDAFPVRDDLVTGDLDNSDGRVVPESGWGALLCWLAGPEHVARLPATAVRHDPVRVEHVTAGARTRTTTERTAADQELIDDSIDGYLTEAGLPPRPRGYAWVLVGTVHGRWRDVETLSAALQRAVSDAGGPAAPAEVLAAGRAALRV